jgi:hypothetical protein
MESIDNELGVGFYLNTRHKKDGSSRARDIPSLKAINKMH